MAQSNDLTNHHAFVPKQALAPTPQLYDQLVGDCMENLAKATVAEIACCEKGSVILDAGCGTGAGTAAVAESVSSDLLSTLSIKGVDNSAASLDVYRQKAIDRMWPAQAILADAADLTATVTDSTFTHVIGTAFLFIAKEDGVPTLEEMMRTLQPGAVATLNTWSYVPNMGPIRVASQKTRPPGTPEIRGGLDKWSDPQFLKSTILKAGFSSNKVIMVQRDVGCYATTFDHYANMLWSFIGGTTSAGWLQSDETNWSRAIEISKEELLQTEGFKLLDDGRIRLKFIANIAIAIK